ncbi:MFS transporter [Streptomyces sp. NBS 14/10]|uniref:MFS transporter n=1 Tax=Streptomyces sp. NBS 14/10 TaxID=1945643 RepID=UPI000B7CC3BD|nr:MFS transporter [Streptomyces sp. NBS 14/10]KAK1177878.1 MFS transporter [Streptomyces sp. NBS 14/10]
MREWQGAGKRPTAALLALSVAAFCYVSVETVPVGLLSVMSSDLGVSSSRIGLLVTGYGATVAVVSLPLAWAVARVPRRPLLLGLMAVLVAATAVSAMTPGYGSLFTARLLTALSQAVFWAVVTPVAAGMFPAHVRGRVTAVVFTGGSLGPMLGVPAGTWLGQEASWRLTFLALAALGLLALLTLAVAMPASPAYHEHAGRGTTPDARRYALVLAVTTLSVAGFFTLFTYTSTFVTVVAGIPAALLSPLLVARGLADFGGVTVGGYLSDRDQRLSVALPAALLTATLLAMFAVGTNPLVTAGALVLTGSAMGALTPALQNRVMEFAPGGTDTASAGNSIAYNVGIAVGSSLGGLTMTHFGPRSIALAGAALAAAATLIALWPSAPGHPGTARTKEEARG